MEKETPDQSLREQFERTLKGVKDDTLLSKQYRKRQFTLWLIRTGVAVVLYMLFWKYEWVRWTLVIYAPLSLFSLLSIYGWNFLIKRKISRTERKISEAEEIIKNFEKE